MRNLLFLVALIPVSGTSAQSTVDAVATGLQSTSTQHAPCPQEPACAGLPEILDKDTPRPDAITDVTKYRAQDALIHAVCEKAGDFSTCKPLTNTRVQNLSGGLLTSTARTSAQDLQTALRADQRVSDFAKSSHGAFHGLCDVSFYSDYAIPEITACLKMPGMIGVGELNLNGDGSFSKNATIDPDKTLLGHRGYAYRHLSEIADAVAKSGGGTISFHMGNTYDPASPASEADALLEIAARYPKVHFIVVHSGLFMAQTQSFGVQGLKKIGDYYKAHPRSPRNVWTDLSSTAGNLAQPAVYSQRCSYLKKQADLAAAWRAFGLDHVLMGSDNDLHPDGVDQYDYIKKSISAVVANPFLTPAEKQQIFDGNMKRLTKTVDRRN